MQATAAAAASRRSAAPRAPARSSCWDRARASPRCAAAAARAAPRPPRPGRVEGVEERVVVGRLCERRAARLRDGGVSARGGAGGRGRWRIRASRSRRARSVLELVVARGGRGAEARGRRAARKFTRSAAAGGGPATRPPPRGRRASRRAARGHGVAERGRVTFEPLGALSVNPRRRKHKPFEGGLGTAEGHRRGCRAVRRAVREPRSRGCSGPPLADDERVGGGEAGVAARGRDRGEASAGTFCARGHDPAASTSPRPARDPPRP